MLMKRVRRGCTFHTAFPQRTLLTIPIMLRTRRDTTRRPCKQIVIWAASAHQEDGWTGSYFRCPWLAYDSLFLLGGRFKPVDQG